MKIHLNLYVRTDDFHCALWRKEADEAKSPVEKFIALAKLAETGLFDSVFLDDAPLVRLADWHYVVSPFDPFLVVAAAARETSHIGLICTYSTDCSQPFSAAWQFASLDHLSHGRAGWNFVAHPRAEPNAEGSSADASPSDLYLRAAEFLNVVLKLWDSWEEDAFTVDGGGNVLVDPTKVHPIEHEGKSFRVRGALNMARPPQGHPLLVHVGSSQEGIAYGARVADVIFATQETLRRAQRFYGTSKALVRQFRREPDRVKVLSCISPVIGSTVAEANKLAGEQQEVGIRHALRALSVALNVDLTRQKLDGPVPLDKLPPPRRFSNGGGPTQSELIASLCASENMTVRELAQWYSSRKAPRKFVGTAEQLADDLETWIKTRAADGFNLVPNLADDGLTTFIEQVVPELQRRGLFRKTYESTSLRGLYGLPYVTTRDINSVVSART